MPDQLKNLFIGIFVVAALAIVVFMLLFLHPSLGDEGQTVTVRFTDIDKVNVGTRVIFAGRPIGEVKKIREINESKEGRTEHKGDIYVYELDLRIDSGTKIFNSDSISLRTSGLLGEKSVSIDPQPLKPGQEARIVNTEVIYAEGTGSVEDTFKEFKEVADKFDVALDAITDALNELKDRGVWENLGITAENLADITSSLSEQWGDVKTTITNVADTSANAREISEKIKDGEGTLGQLISKDDMYLRATSMLSKGETILDDINHYGVLFHLDKGWQRLRARRMNLLQQLTTPQEFRNYFNDEVNRISTSLSRVGMVLDKTECYPNLMDDKEYEKVFAELLRRVTGLEEALKMYNIQVVENESAKTELSGKR